MTAVRGLEGPVRGRSRAARATTILVTAFALAAVSAPAPALGASTIFVTTLSDTEANDGFCSLREAIKSANTDTGLGGCVAGGGFDTIIASVAGVVQLNANLPAITTAMAIDGTHQLVIDGMGAWQPIRNDATLTLEDITIRNGRGTFQAVGTFGGAIANGGTFLGVNLTLSANDADFGGAIYNNGTPFTLIRSTVNGNEASFGGGIYLEKTGTLANVTFQGNKAASGGGAIYAIADAFTKHLTIVGNTAPTGGGINQVGGLLSVINSIVIGNTGGNRVSSAGTQNIVTSLMSGSTTGVVDTVLRDNGGPTKTLSLLKTATAALGKGTGDVCFEAPVSSQDQRGQFRGSTTCDLGAVERDRVVPVVSTGAKVGLRSGAALSGTSSRAKVQWAGSDNDEGIGLDRFTLQRQVNGGSWATIATLAGSDGSTLVQRSQNVTLSKDKSYRFRVRAVDEDGNISAWSYTPTVTARLVQQSSSSVAFSSGWTTASSTKYSGGSLRYARSDNRSARYTFTGRSVAFVTTVRVGGTGEARIYVDGVLQSTIHLASSTTTTRYQAFVKQFSRSNSHTIRIVTEGSGRVDVDAFAVLR
jgi:CSLREA domain-containing protein